MCVSWVTGSVRVNEFKLNCFYGIFLHIFYAFSPSISLMTSILTYSVTYFYNCSFSSVVIIRKAQVEDRQLLNQSILNWSTRWWERSLGLFEEYQVGTSSKHTYFMKLVCVSVHILLITRCLGLQNLSAIQDCYFIPARSVAITSILRNIWTRVINMCTNYYSFDNYWSFFFFFNIFSNK